MTDIVAFIRARLDEDEAAAQAAESVGGARWRGDIDLDADNFRYAVLGSDGDRLARLYESEADSRRLASHIARHDPARVLRQVAVLRAIVAVHSPGIDPCDAHDARFETIPCETLEHLAGIWSDHPDFDPGWSAVGSEGGKA